MMAVGLLVGACAPTTDQSELGNGLSEHAGQAGAESRRPVNNLTWLKAKTGK